MRGRTAGNCAHAAEGLGRTSGPITNLQITASVRGYWSYGVISKGIDGVSMNVRDLPPCIFLNRNVPPDRMRFSLAYELGLNAPSCTVSVSAKYLPKAWRAMVMMWNLGALFGCRPLD